MSFGYLCHTKPEVFSFSDLQLRLVDLKTVKRVNLLLSGEYSSGFAWHRYKAKHEQCYAGVDILAYWGLVAHNAVCLDLNLN